MLDGRWKTNIEAGLKPVGRSIRRAGIRADHLTGLGIVMATAASVVIGNGWLTLGFVLLVATGIPDALDGAVAKASGTTGPRGAFFDSVADRLTDALLFGGVSWYLLSNFDGRIGLLPMAVYAAASLVSYQRAKAEALGFEAKGGIMERAERFVFLGFGLLFNHLLIATLWVMFALTAFTAVQRFVKVWRQAERPPAPPRPARPRRRERVPRTTRRWTGRQNQQRSSQGN